MAVIPFLFSEIALQMGWSAFSNASDLELFASHMAVLHVLKNDGVPISLDRHILPPIRPLLGPSRLSEFTAIMLESLPEEVWRLVLGFADPAAYQTFSRRAMGVSREFYYLQKNSVVSVHLFHPPTLLNGMMWFLSRANNCAPIEYLTVSFPVTAHHVIRLLECPGFREVSKLVVLRRYFGRNRDLWNSWCFKRFQDDLVEYGLQWMDVQEGGSM